MKRFYIQFAFFLICVGTSIFLWNYYMPAKIKIADEWISFSILAVTTFIIRLFLFSAEKKHPAHFVTAYLGSTAIKLGVFLLIIIFYMLVKRDSAFNFVGGFLALYFLFSAFEVIILIKHFQK